MEALWFAESAHILVTIWLNLERNFYKEEVFWEILLSPDRCFGVQNFLFRTAVISEVHKKTLYNINLWRKGSNSAGCDCDWLEKYIGTINTSVANTHQPSLKYTDQCSKEQICQLPKQAYTDKPADRRTMAKWVLACLRSDTVLPITG